MFYDSSWYGLVLPFLALALLAQWNIKSTFNRFSKISGARGLTGAEVARMILDQSGLSDIPVQPISGNLTDYYDPRSKVICLSSSVYSSSSLAAVGVAAHECGHAIQHATHYGPLTFRNSIIKITNIGSTAAVPVFLLGLFLNFTPLMSLGILLYSLIALFQLVTLPVEYNASSRAVATIEERGFLTADEAKGAKKVLHSAALTYVAALASTLAQLLRLIIIRNSRRN